jgi:hypothetical protein
MGGYGDVRKDKTSSLSRGGHARDGRAHFEPALHGLQDDVRDGLAKSTATSSIKSSCPPTVRRRPSSTKMSRDETPYRSAARFANSKNDE